MSAVAVKTNQPMASVVYVIDDDSSVLSALEDLFASAGLRARCFESPAKFLLQTFPKMPSCLVLDVRIPGQNGMDFHRCMADLGLRMPVIFITGHGDIAMGVEAMKNGAIEFLAKPFRDSDLLRAVSAGLQQDNERLLEEARLKSLRERWSALSAAERDLLHSLIQGQLNMRVALQVGVTDPTEKITLARALRAMKAETLAELASMLLALGIVGQGRN